MKFVVLVWQNGKKVMWYEYYSTGLRLLLWHFPLFHSSLLPLGPNCYVDASRSQVIPAGEPVWVDSCTKCRCHDGQDAGYWEGNRLATCSRLRNCTPQPPPTPVDWFATQPPVILKCIWSDGWWASQLILWYFITEDGLNLLMNGESANAIGITHQNLNVTKSSIKFETM